MKPKLVIFMMFVLLLSCAKQKTVEIVEVEPILNLTALKPKINIGRTLLSFSNNFFAIDGEGNLYFLDRANHRVLRFSDEGTFLNQIGEIGQEKECFYYPVGIYIYENVLFVLDNEGRKLKMFSLDGKYINGFIFPNAYSAESLFVYEDKIFISIKTKNEENYNQNKLIHVFNTEGVKIKKFGETVKSVKYNGYVMFNKVAFSINQNHIYIGFNFLPILKKIALDHSESLSTDLSSLNITEIKKIKNEGIVRNIDSPDSIKEQNEVSAMRYCYNLAVDSQENIYYAANYDKALKGIIIKFDKELKVQNKFMFKFNNKILRIRCLYLYRKMRYFIGQFNENFYLCEMNIK